MKFVLGKMVSVPMKIKPDIFQIYIYKDGQGGVKRHGNKRSGTGANIQCKEYEKYEKGHMKMEPEYAVNVGDEMK